MNAEAKEENRNKKILRNPYFTVRFEKGKNTEGREKQKTSAKEEPEKKRKKITGRKGK